MKKKTVTKYIFYILFFFIPLFLISAFRDRLGSDYNHYAFTYNYPNSWNDEFLFKFIFITLPRLFFKNEIVLFILTSLVINIYFFKTFFRYSQIIYLSILIYIFQIYFSSFNVVRQFVAIALFSYYGAKYLNEKQIYKYLILVLFLAQIHFSMYLMLIFPFLGGNELKIKSYWYIWLGSFLFFLLQYIDVLSLLALLDLLKKLPIKSEKLDLYLLGSKYFYNLFTGNTQLLIKNVFCIVFILRLKYYKEKSSIYWFNLYFFAILLYNVFVKFSVLAVRIAYFGDVSLLILVPIFINSFSLKYNRIVLIAFFILYFFVNFYIRFVINGESEVFKQGLGSEWGG